VQFIPYKEFLDEVRSAGVAANQSGGQVMFTLTSADGALQPARVRIGSGSAPGASEQDDRSVVSSAERLPELIERLFHKARVAEVAVAPAQAWRNILDVALYDLAQDEDWLTVDAEASLHQNGRDPLLLASSEYQVLRLLAGAVLKNGQGDNSRDFTAVAPGSPMVVEFHAAGFAVVWCASEAVADEVAAALAT